MADVFDYAKYLISQSLASFEDTFDGNMKLQKLLVFANLISFAERGIPLFNDEILAFTHGCVVEKVRHRYRGNYAEFIAESKMFSPKFSQDECNILDLTISLFGHLSARELSNTNHTFDFWRNAYESSIQENNYKDKSKAVVSLDAMAKESEKMQKIIQLFRQGKNESNCKETINGVDFHYSHELSLTDDLLDTLYDYSLSAEDLSYSVYLDGDNLVIY